MSVYTSESKVYIIQKGDELLCYCDNFDDALEIFDYVQTKTYNLLLLKEDCKLKKESMYASTIYNNRGEPCITLQISEVRKAMYPHFK